MQATSEGVKKKAREVRSRIMDKPRHRREADAYEARLDAFRQTLNPEQRALFDHEKKLDSLETDISHEQHYRRGMVVGAITALFPLDVDTLLNIETDIAIDRKMASESQRRFYFDESCRTSNELDAALTAKQRRENWRLDDKRPAPHQAIERAGRLAGRRLVEALGLPGFDFLVEG
jgi:hypothetical protein